jgi:tellurite resistance-related uncharacterized protein
MLFCRLVWQRVSGPGERNTTVRKLAPVALAGLLACVWQQSMAQSGGSLDNDLRYSQLCAKAARDFRSQPEWRNQNEPRTFTSHFNKKMGKCLVKVTSFTVLSGKNEVLEMQHVYDALEGTVLGGKIVTKEGSRNGEQKTLGILMVRDGRMLGKNNPDEAREAYQWFEALMKE